MRRWLMVTMVCQGCWVTEADISERVSSLRIDSAVPPEDTDTTPDIVFEDTDVDAPPTCPEIDGASGFDAPIAQGDNTDATDRHLGSCADRAGGVDVSVGWTAPFDGCFIFTTTNSEFNSVLYLLDDCDGEELACNDDAAAESGTLQSEIHREIAEGTSLVAVVDGWSEEDLGQFDLTVLTGNKLPLTGDLGSRTGAVGQGTNLLAGSLFEPWNCPSMGYSGADVAFTWTAPESATWSFTNVGTNYDAVLSVHRLCELHAIGCSDSSVKGGERIDLTLDAGEVVVVRIAGWQLLDGFLELPARGNYALQINALE